MASYSGGITASGQSAPSTSINTNSASSSSGPYAPEYLGNAAGSVEDMVNTAKTNASDQQGALLNFINNLYKMRNLVMRQAASSAAKGASGQQNPLAVYKAVHQMAQDAGIPLTANISQALLMGKNIGDTLTNMLSQASSHYTQMASIPQSSSQSSGQGQGGGTVMKFGGDSKKNSGGRGGSGDYTDIRGNRSAFAPPRQGLAEYEAEQDAFKQGQKKKAIEEEDARRKESEKQQLQSGNQKFGEGFYSPQELSAYDGGSGTPTFSWDNTPFQIGQGMYSNSELQAYDGGGSNVGQYGDFNQFNAMDVENPIGEGMYSQRDLNNYDGGGGTFYTGDQSYQENIPYGQGVYSQNELNAYDGGGFTSDYRGTNGSFANDPLGYSREDYGQYYEPYGF